eukprot:m.279676 g.279676  ORF g.279676 m.279676 type:complete len:157 (-) comp54907_c0_seq11:1482-1952(-)
MDSRVDVPLLSSVYVSRVKTDSWVYLILAFPVLLLGGLFVYGLSIENYTMAGVEAGAALLVLGLFFFVIPRRYELTEAALVLVLGFRWHIPYENIVSIEEVDLFAGVCACKFSLSIDNRLRIERRSGLPVIITPLDSTEFLSEFRKRKSELAATKW